MKKVIIAAAIILTSGILATNANSTKTAKTTVTTSEKNVVATAD